MVSLFVFRFSLVIPVAVVPALVVGPAVTQSFAVSGAISVVTLLVTTAAFLYATGRERSYVDLGRSSITPRAVAVGLGAGGVLVAVQRLLTAVAAEAGITVASADYATGTLAELAAVVATAVVLVPAAEELFYRNLLQKYLAETLPAAVAVGVTAVAFASAHTFNFLGQPLPEIGAAVSVITVQGVLLGAVYHRTENLLVSISAHAVNNLVALAVTA